MAECKVCGFDRYEEGKVCPLCGYAEHAMTVIHERPASEPRSSLEEIEPAFTPSKSAGGRFEIPKGQLVEGRYLVQRMIGRGGMGSVYEVQDVKGNRTLALKILNQISGEDDSEQRFLREFEMMSKIDHPAILKVYGWGRYQDQVYFVSEFIQGRDLKSEIKRRGPWPAAEAAKLVATIADALAVAHSMKIVHRDLKPHNIMLANDGSVRLLDFGVARKTGGAMETLTKTGMMVGTPEYMSPEQFGTHRVDERSDLYSLGVVLFELLTGQVPFGGETPVAIAMKVIQHPSVAPQSVRRDIPEWVDRIVVKCMDKDPKNRYLNAAQLAEDLRKPNARAKPTMRKLPNGDSVVLDTNKDAKFPLILASDREKNWDIAMPLRFSDNFYKLQEILPAGMKGPRWYYHFSKWPEEEILRGLVDYDQHSETSAEKPSFFKRLFGNK
jgi:serine/threonine protein kinase